MLPPTIIAAPTSATTWPKAAVMTAARANRASRATAPAVRHVPAPSVSAVRRMRGSTRCTAAAERARDHGGDDGDLHRQQRDTVDLGVGRADQMDGAAQPFG